MEPTILGLVLDSSYIIEAERKRQTVEEFLSGIRQVFGEIEISISAVTVAELAHGVARANTPEIRGRRRAFIDELKMHVPVHPVLDECAEIGVAAIKQGYAVLTLNLRHFRMIPGLTLVQR